MSTVTFHSIGRFGNFLFQCAAAIGYAKKYNMKWLCPSNFGENPTIYSSFPNLPVGEFWGGERYEAHDASMFSYQEIPYFPQGVKLIGFFQSEKYFKNAEEEVREAFKLIDFPELRDYCSIHIRLTDYIIYSNSFPPITADYLREAFKLFPSAQKYLVFSDDIEGARKMFELYFPAAPNIEYSEGDPKDPMKNFCMMASCSHNIIANSSYSWWAAWLNKNSNKVVVSPHATSWFGPNGPTKTEDLIPDSWHQIKFR